MFLASVIALYILAMRLSRVIFAVLCAVASISLAANSAHTMESSDPVASTSAPLVLARGGANALRLSGRIVVEAGGRNRTIPLGAAERLPAGSRAWDLSRRIVVRRVRPLWERSDGKPIANDPAYRRREFTAAGQLVGRPVTVAFRVRLRVQAPRWVRGVRARVEIDDLSVAAHRYRGRRTKIIDEHPAEIGRLPSQILTARSGGPAGDVALASTHEADWRGRPGHEDIVRLAGCALAVRCRYRIVLECFGEDNGTRLADAGSRRHGGQAPRLMACEGATSFPGGHSGDSR